MDSSEGNRQWQEQQSEYMNTNLDDPKIWGTHLNRHEVVMGLT